MSLTTFSREFAATVVIDSNELRMAQSHLPRQFSMRELAARVGSASNAHRLSLRDDLVQLMEEYYYDDCAEGTARLRLPGAASNL